MFATNVEMSREEIRDYLFDPIRVLGVSFFVIATLSTITAFAINYTLEYQLQKSKDIIQSGQYANNIKGIKLDEVNSFYSRFTLIKDKIENKNNLFGIINVLSVIVEENSYFNNFSWKVDNNNSADLSLSVISKTLESAILQKDRFLAAVYDSNNAGKGIYDYRSAGIIKSMKIGDVSEGGDNTYKFTVTLKVDNKKQYDAIEEQINNQRKDAKQEIRPKKEEKNPDTIKSNNPASNNNTINNTTTIASTTDKFKDIPTGNIFDNLATTTIPKSTQQKTNLLEIYNKR